MKGVGGGKLWCTLKYDRMKFLQFASDADVVNLMKGNDDHEYMYVAGDGGRCAVPAYKLNGLC